MNFLHLLVVVSRDKSKAFMVAFVAACLVLSGLLLYLIFLPLGR
jgi:hypothetical protein